MVETNELRTWDSIATFQSVKSAVYKTDVYVLVVFLHIAEKRGDYCKLKDGWLVKINKWKPADKMQLSEETTAKTSSLLGIA